jgi:RNA polymerase sigma-70 factor (ECF subfamily)
LKKNLDYTQLIADCQNGSSRAQQLLFKTFYGMIFKVCMRYAKSYEEAQDMLSESFLKIFTHLDQYKTTGSFESWITTLSTHAAIDYLRKYSPKWEAVNMDDVNEANELTSVENGALARLSSQDLMQLIQQLPQQSRTVFNLFVFEGYSHAEIAKILNIKEGTSFWHLNFARKELKKKIKN